MGVREGWWAAADSWAGYAAYVHWEQQSHPRSHPKAHPTLYLTHPAPCSEGTFIRRGSDEVASSIGRRVAEWTHLPEENAEDLQVSWHGCGVGGCGQVCTRMGFRWRIGFGQSRQQKPLTPQETQR